MQTINFFTPVSFGNRPKSCAQLLLETVDSYFYLGDKKAYVIPNHTQLGAEGAILSKDSPAFLITALKVASYLTVALPVIMLITKTILRSIHTFHIVDVKQELEEGINISRETAQKINELIPRILKREEEDNPDIVKYTSNNLIFSLKSVPDLIFKSVYSAERRFENMVKAREVCLAHQLNHLIIPHARKINIAGSTFIAEERFNIQQDESRQEQLYTELSGLNDAARELATFIAKTGFSDVEWRNIPIVDDDPDFTGSRRVALVDLEEMDDAQTGIFGGGLGRRRGLIKCLSSAEQIDIALTEAQRCGVTTGRWITPAQVKIERLNEVQNYNDLQQFYIRNEISNNAQKPIQVNLNTLGLNLDEKGSSYISEVHKNCSDGTSYTEHRQITLKDAVIDVIALINQAIAKTPENASIKGKRYILLNINNNPSLKLYNYLGLPKDKVIFTEAEEEQRWLRRIINALVAKGNLFKLDRINGYGYFIQA